MSVSGDIGRFLAQSRQYFRSVAMETRGIRDRLAKLRTAVVEPHAPEACPACNTGRLRVISLTREPMMGELGPQESTLECENARCGHRESRMHGYSVRVEHRTE